MQKLTLTIHKEKEVTGSKTSLKVFFFKPCRYEERNEPFFAQLRIILKTAFIWTLLFAGSRPLASRKQCGVDLLFSLQMEKDILCNLPCN